MNPIAYASGSSSDEIAVFLQRFREESGYGAFQHFGPLEFGLAVTYEDDSVSSRQTLHRSAHDTDPPVGVHSLPPVFVCSHLLKINDDMTAPPRNFTVTGKQRLTCQKGRTWYEGTVETQFRAQLVRKPVAHG